MCSRLQFATSAARWPLVAACKLITRALVRASAPNRQSAAGRSIYFQTRAAGRLPPALTLHNSSVCVCVSARAPCNCCACELTWSVSSGARLPICFRRAIARWQHALCSNGRKSHSRRVISHLCCVCGSHLQVKWPLAYVCSWALAFACPLARSPARMCGLSAQSFRVRHFPFKRKKTQLSPQRLCLCGFCPLRLATRETIARFRQPIDLTRRPKSHQRLCESACVSPR